MKKKNTKNVRFPFPYATYRLENGNAIYETDHNGEIRIPGAYFGELKRGQMVRYHLQISYNSYEQFSYDSINRCVFQDAATAGVLDLPQQATCVLEAKANPVIRDQQREEQTQTFSEATTTFRGEPEMAFSR